MKQLKLAVKLFVIAAIVACIAPFFLKNKTGSPLLTWDKIKMPDISMPDINIPFFKKNPPKPAETELLSDDSMVPEEGQDVEAFYTYKDENGITHITNQKPNRDDYQVTYLPQFKEEEKSGLDKIKDKITSLTDNDEKTKPGAMDDSSFLTPYSKAGDTIEDARKLKEQVEGVYRDRDNMIDEDK